MKQLKNKIKCMLSYSIYNGELHFYYLAAFHEVIALFLFTVAKRSIFHINTQNLSKQTR